MNPQNPYGILSPTMGSFTFLTTFITIYTYNFDYNIRCSNMNVKHCCFYFQLEFKGLNSLLVLEIFSLEVFFEGGEGGA